MQKICVLLIVCLSICLANLLVKVYFISFFLQNLFYLCLFYLHDDRVYLNRHGSIFFSIKNRTIKKNYTNLLNFFTFFVSCTLPVL